MKNLHICMILAFLIEMYHCLKIENYQTILLQTAAIDEEEARIIVQQQYAQIISEEGQSEETNIEDQDTRLLADAIIENTYETQQLKVIVLEDQLEKLQEQLIAVNEKILNIQNNLPQVDQDDECSQYKTCKQCTSKIQCGFCVMEQMCVRGDNIGPLYTLCNFYDYQYCSGPVCSKYKDCDSCLSDPLCGYCEDQAHMIISCLEQPPNFTGCPALGYYHREGAQNTCPVKEKPKPIDMYDADDDLEEKKSRKGQKKAEEPIDVFRPRTWEENLINEKAKILNERQKALNGQTITEKGLFLDKARQDLEFLEQQQLSINEKLMKVRKQLGIDDTTE